MGVQTRAIVGQSPNSGDDSPEIEYEVVPEKERVADSFLDESARVLAVVMKLRCCGARPKNPGNEIQNPLTIP